VTDAETVTNLLANLNNYLLKLKRLAQISKNNFLADDDKIGSAKYYLIVAIEIVIDIAHHIIAEYRLRRPEDYSDSIKVLEESDYLTPELSEKLQEMIKFRNLLVHMYAKVDDERVYRYLIENLRDFSEFAQAIAKLIS